MGFGHRVYKHSDPRSDVIKGWAIKLAAEDVKGRKLMEVAERIDAVMKREKNFLRTWISTVLSRITYAEFQRPFSLHSLSSQESRVGRPIS